MQPIIAQALLQEFVPHRWQSSVVFISLAAGHHMFHSAKGPCFSLTARHGDTKLFVSYCLKQRFCLSGIIYEVMIRTCWDTMASQWGPNEKSIKKHQKTSESKDNIRQLDGPEFRRGVLTIGHHVACVGGLL